MKSYKNEKDLRKNRVKMLDSMNREYSEDILKIKVYDEDKVYTIDELLSSIIELKAENERLLKDVSVLLEEQGKLKENVKKLNTSLTKYSETSSYIQKVQASTIDNLNEKVVILTNRLLSLEDKTKFM